MILGVAWLATLGEKKVNGSTMTMTFLNQGSAVEVRADPSLAKTLISPRTLLKVAEVEAVSLLWVIESSKEPQKYEQVLTETQQDQLQQLLKEFEQVFTVPERLPPNRDVDHSIPIKGGTDPVNVRPYRYPHIILV